MSACDLRPPEQQLITASARSSALEAKNDFAERSLYKTEKSIHITSEVLLKCYAALVDFRQPPEVYTARSAKLARLVRRGDPR